MSENHETTSVGICVPTVRPAQMQQFLQAWAPSWCEERGVNLTLFVHEDHTTRQCVMPQMPGLKVVHTCHQDLSERLGADHWIIPRQSGACRSFPMYLAWKAGCEYIITLDDDCLPEGDPAVFVAEHLSAFAQDRWFRTIDGAEPRGIPYGDRGQLPVLLNHGLWTGTPDLDGPTSLQQLRGQTMVTVRAAREIVPPGMWFPLCAMNVCYHREAIPAAYNLLMGFEAYGLDRFDDIWSGILLKRVADHLGRFIANGRPLIHHSKASNPYRNMRVEALGIDLNERFWQHIDKAPLGNAATVSESYAQMAEWVGRFSLECPDTPAPSGYFDQLGRAMTTWLTLFAGKVRPGARA